MEEKKPIRGIIVNMKIGDKKDFPVMKMSTVRTTASIVSYELGRRYRTTHDREHKRIVVERVR